MLIKSLRISQINETYRRTLMLLDKEIKVEDNRAGWYHLIGEKRFGNVATAQGILINSYLNKSNSLLNKILYTLKESQYRGENVFDIGGWSFVTSTQNAPTLEAAAWVLLGLIAGGEPSNSNIIKDGKEWIKRNQNLDGGWGSKKESCSRIYTTFLACRCFSTLEPNLNRENIRDVLNWVLSCQNAVDGGWGATRGEASTPIHTAFALLTLHTLGIGITTEMQRGIQYLYTQWNPQTMWEHTPKLEQYDVSKEGAATRITFHYFPTPWIITALLNIGESIFQEQIFLGIKWLVQSQNEDGSWSVSQVPKNRFWAIHDAILAITTFLDKAISTQTVDSMIKMGNIIILAKSQKDFARGAILSIIGLLMLGSVAGAILSSATTLGPLVQKYWAWIFLGIWIFSIYPLVKLKLISKKDAILSIVFPVFLVVIQPHLGS